jgi:hypothetical protein
VAEEHGGRVPSPNEVEMNAHVVVSELLGAWALDACDDVEQASVEEHLLDCDECAVQARRLRAAASWLSVDRVAPAPVPLRQTVLARAVALRPSVPRSTLVEAYAGQVAGLGRLLDSISSEDWLREDPRHGDVAGVIGHLADNDGLLVDDLDAPAAVGVGAASVSAGSVSAGSVSAGSVGAAAAGRWRGQAEHLIRVLAHQGDLDLPVRMAGRGEPVRRPLRDALVQRAFETWIHTDDVASLVGRSGRAPSPEQVRRIADLAARLLPAAVRADGISVPGQAARLVLTGPAGGEWHVPLGEATSVAATVAFTASLDAVEFARLVANRRTPETIDYAVTGDPSLAARVLRVAATLGCD